MVLLRPASGTQAVLSVRVFGSGVLGNGIDADTVFTPALFCVGRRFTKSTCNLAPLIGALLVR
jgi:hypothetical protein